MAIWFDCKKCGEHLAAVENKTGILIACPKCRAKNKIPGIAMQKQATKEQIEQMETMLKRHKHSLWVLSVLLVFGIGIFLSTMLMDSNVEVKILGIVFFFGLGLIVINSLFAVGPTSGMVFAFSILIFVIFVRILKTCEYLSASKYIQIILCFFLWPVWVIECVILYVKLKNRIAYLKQAGVRSENT